MSEQPQRGSSRLSGFYRQSLAERAATVARHGLILALVLALPAVAIAYFAGPLLLHLGQEPTVVTGATEYLRAAPQDMAGLGEPITKAR